MSERADGAVSMWGLASPLRRMLVVAVHLGIWVAALIGAFLLRFDFKLGDVNVRFLAASLPALLLIRLGAFSYYGLFRGLWRYTGTRDLVALAKATSAATGLFVLFVVFRGLHGFPRSVYIIEWLASFMMVGGLRLAIRMVREFSRRGDIGDDQAQPRRVLIVGAGDAGESLLREIQKSHSRRYGVVGFLDDNPEKRNAQIHGVRVLGPIAHASEIVSGLGVEEIIVAIPTASGRQMRGIVDACKPSGALVRTIPGIDQLIDGRVSVNQVRDVAIEDLLGRAPVVLNTESIASFIRERVVLVTGAGGSIGSELCRQVCRFAPKTIVLFEQAENALFNIHRELVARFPYVEIVPCVGDICDERRVVDAFEKYRPTSVFHAAAHKHVPMMEWNPGEAIKNNVFGSKMVADVADMVGVERFVMISTDKAVNPTSVMGATKRVAEIYIQALSQRSRTRYTTVRFGNVLGSAGSVIPIFKEQISRGGPVTVTHPEMRRYFMTIPEASQLVLQAAAMGRGGEIFVLDMGEPVKIVDLARDLISLSGLRPGEDVEIRFTGMRPGEKLFEELSVEAERAEKTLHPKIFIGKFRPYDWERLLPQLENLRDAASDGGPDAVRMRIKEIVPEFSGDAGLAQSGETQGAAVIALKRA